MNHSARRAHPHGDHLWPDGLGWVAAAHSTIGGLVYGVGPTWQAAVFELRARQANAALREFAEAKAVTARRGALEAAKRLAAQTQPKWSGAYEAAAHDVLRSGMGIVSVSIGADGEPTAAYVGQ